MKLEQALEIAERWVGWLLPSCMRIEIAGSVRRKKPEVHDIELCCIPLFNNSETDMFGIPQTPINILEIAVNGLRIEGGFTLKKDGPKYKQLYLHKDDIALELFIITPPAEWGVLFLIRTGPADFSHWIVTKKRLGGALPSWAEVSGGAVYDLRSGKIITMPEEADFFKFCGLPYMDPWDRKPR